MDDNFGYIVDKYNKYQSNKNVLRVFRLYICGQDVEYCIRKIPLTYDWGTLFLKIGIQIILINIFFQLKKKRLLMCAD